MSIEPRAPAVALPATTGAPTALPTDIVEQAATRLGLVSLIYAATYAIAFYPTVIVAALGVDIPVLPGPVEHTAAALSIGASIAIYVATRWVSGDPATVLDWGLLYQVVASFGIEIEQNSFVSI